jgi:hypothetical protein
MVFNLFLFNIGYNYSKMVPKIKNEQERVFGILKASDNTWQRDEGVEGIVHIIEDN